MLECVGTIQVFVKAHKKPGGEPQETQKNGVHVGRLLAETSVGNVAAGTSLQLIRRNAGARGGVA